MARKTNDNENGEAVKLDERNRETLEALRGKIRTGQKTVSCSEPQPRKQKVTRLLRTRLRSPVSVAGTVGCAVAVGSS